MIHTRSYLNQLTWFDVELYVFVRLNNEKRLCPKIRSKGFSLFYFTFSPLNPRPAPLPPPQIQLFILTSHPRVKKCYKIRNETGIRIHQTSELTHGILSSTGLCVSAPITTPFYLLVPIFSLGLLSCAHERLFSMLHRTEAQTVPSFHLLPHASSTLLCSSRRLEQ